MNITRNNHYVPQLYLDGWAENNKIWRYELIVPNRHFPLWQNGSIEKTGVQRDIYTRSYHGQDTDDLEKWFGTFETKAATPLKKARNGQHLNAADWYALIDFVAIQYLRTPSSVARLMSVARDALQEGLESAARSLSGPHAKQEVLNRPHANDLEHMIPVSIDINRETGELRTNAIAGKSTSLMCMKLIMEGNARNVLHQNRWGIISCDPCVSWPTSDNPVVLLNYHADGSYDFKGGWGNKNTEIIMPISSSKAIYTKVKSHQSPRIHCDAKMSAFVRKIIIENAYRFVYSNFEDLSVPSIRQRAVDSEVYKQVKDQYDEFHHMYVENEVPMIEGRSHIQS